MLDRQVRVRAYQNLNDFGVSGSGGLRRALRARTRSAMRSASSALRLMLGCGGYLAGLVAAHVSPDFESSLTVFLGLPAGLAEVLFLLWLLVVGVRMPLEDKQVASAA